MESDTNSNMADSASAPTEPELNGDRSQLLIDELKKQREIIKQGGGPKRIEAQHAKGKLTARERLGKLLDEGSFQEIDPFITHRHLDFGMDRNRHPGDSVITGFGKINGRPICLFVQDFTLLGGSFGEVQGQKVAKAMDLAIEAGVPFIGLNDSGGARIQEGVYSLGAYAEVFWRNTQASGVIPQISVILGPCAGGAVYSPGLTDFIFMANQTSHMFITGPQVIKTVTGEEVDFETLGGAGTHSSQSGVAHFVGAEEESTLGLVRKLLGYLPANNAEPAPAIEPTDDPWRMDTDLNTLVPIDPNEGYDMKVIINKVFDAGSFFEVHQNFAQNAVVGFARLHGQVVGVSANQPVALAGVIDIDASDKIARFVRFCDAFNIPVFTFCDTPGFMPGVTQEHGGIIRHGAKIIYAYSEATVPKITVNIRKGYGGAYIVMGSKYLRTDIVYAWPTTEIAVMGAEGAVNILYGKHLKDVEDPEGERALLVKEYRQKFSTPYTSAASGFVNDILVPAETRPRLIAALELLRNKQTTLPPKKHGNLPL